MPSFPLLEYAAFYQAQLSAPPHESSGSGHPLSGHGGGSADRCCTQSSGAPPPLRAQLSEWAVLNPPPQQPTATPSSSSLLQEEPAVRGLLEAYCGDLLYRQWQRRALAARIEGLDRAWKLGGTSFGQRVPMSTPADGAYACAAAAGSPGVGGSGGAPTTANTSSAEPPSAWHRTDGEASSDDGLFLQIPTRRYCEQCRRWCMLGDSAAKAPRGGLPYADHLRYFSENAAAAASEGSSADRRNDEGFLYGYCFFVAMDGKARCGSGLTSSTAPDVARGVLLCLLSSSPVFTFVRSLVLQLVPMVEAAVSLALHTGEDVAARLQALLRPLAGLLDPRSTISSALCGTPLSIPMPGGWQALTASRPADLLYPFMDTPIATLLLSFPFDALRVLQTLLLSEKRVLFIGATPQQASACCVSATALLSPMVWCPPIIPYLPPAHATESGLLDTLLCITVSQQERRARATAAKSSGEYLLGLADARLDTESNGFLIGSTPQLVGHVMLRMSAIAAAYDCVLCDDDRVWIADARTGNIGVTPLDPITRLSLVSRSAKGQAATQVSAVKGGGTSPIALLTSAPVSMAASYVALDLLPANERLRSALNGIISCEQRLAFRLEMETAAVLQQDYEAQGLEELAQLEVLVAQVTARSDDGVGSNSESEDCDTRTTRTDPSATPPPLSFAMSSGSTLPMLNQGASPTPLRGGDSAANAAANADFAVAEIHAAILEGNAQRLGNYQRGFTRTLTSSASARQAGSGLQVGNVNGWPLLATAHACTHTFARFEEAMIAAEALGGMPKVLHRDGGVMREGHLTGYYLSHPRMIALLSLFVERCRRAHPYTELSYRAAAPLPEAGGGGATFDGVRNAHAVGAAAVRGLTSSRLLLPEITAIAVGDGDPGMSAATTTAKISSPSSGNGMKKLFTKVKATITGKSGGASGRAMTVPIPVFVQALPCLGGPLVLTPVTKSKKLCLQKPKEASHRKQRSHRRESGDLSKAARMACQAAQSQRAVLSVDFTLPDPSVAAEMLSAVGCRAAWETPPPGNFPRGGSTEHLHPAALGKNGDFDIPTAVSAHCRPLPLDVVHQFSSYHPLLRPAHHTSVPRTEANSTFPRSTHLTTGYCSSLLALEEEEDRTMSLRAVRQYLALGLLCPSSARVWQRMEWLMARTLLSPGPLPAATNAGGVGSTRDPHASHAFNPTAGPPRQQQPMGFPPSPVPHRTKEGGAVTATTEWEGLRPPHEPPRLQVRRPVPPSDHSTPLLTRPPTELTLPAVVVASVLDPPEVTDSDGVFFTSGVPEGFTDGRPPLCTPLTCSPPPSCSVTHPVHDQIPPHTERPEPSPGRPHRPPEEVEMDALFGWSPPTTPTQQPPPMSTKQPPVSLEDYFGF